MEKTLVGPRGEAIRPAASAGGAPAVIDVDVRTFEAEVIRRSAELPVVVDFWAPWCGPCKTLTPVLERLASEMAGRFVLARVNIDENPEIAEAFGVRSIPAVVALVGGRAVDAFVGALPEREVRRFLDRAIGPARAAGGAAVATPEEMLGAGRYDEARTEFSRRLEADPGDVEAILGLARIAALRGKRAEAEGYLQGLPSSHAESPTAAAVRTVAALDLRDPRAACEGLLEEVRRSRGEARDAARARLVALFDVLGRSSALAEEFRERLARVLF